MVAPISPQTKQRWKEQSSPLSGRLRACVASPTPLGRAQAVGTAGSHPADLPGARGFCLCRSLWAAAGSRRLSQSWWKGCDFFLGVQEELPQASPGANFPAQGPHLVGCHLDCASDVLNEKAVPALLRKKPAGKKLQSREGRELVRSARKGPSLAESWREPQENSPGNTCGHRALSLLFCTHRWPGQPLPGDTACTLRRREQMPLGMSTSAGLG